MIALMEQAKKLAKLVKGCSPKGNGSGILMSVADISDVLIADVLNALDAMFIRTIESSALSAANN